MQDLNSKLDQFSSAKNKDQLDINQEIKQNDEKRNYGTFKSLRKYPRFSNFVGIFILLLIMVFAISGALYLKNQEVGTEESQAGKECSDLQVKIITQDGYICQDCGAGEYGTLEFCEEDTGGVCTKNEQTKCFRRI